MGDFFDSLTGSDAADASMDAAKIQAASSDKALKQQSKFLKKMRKDFAPYRAIGKNQLAGLNNLVNNPAAQLDYIQNNPFFSALADDAQNRLLNIQAASGRLGTGDTPAALQNQLLLLGNDLLQQGIGNKFNLANMGQNAAGMTGNAMMNVGNNMSELITGKGNALAAGQVGAANARAAGASNLLNAGLTGLGILHGNPITLSDRRFKCNVRKIGELAHGIGIYIANYVGSAIDMVCCMAQEVEPIIPGAVLDVFGVKFVDYDELERALKYAH